MEKDSIIAQVDATTEKIMNDIAEDITSGISDNLQDVTNGISDSLQDITKGISDNLQHITNDTQKIFSTLQQACQSLNRLDDLPMSLAEIKAMVGKVNDLNDKLSALKDELASLQLHIENHVDDNLRNHTEVVKDYLVNVRDEGISQMLSVLDKNNIEAVQRIDGISQRMDMIETQLREQREADAAKMDQLSVSMVKLQETMDVIVELNTPFWKKWSRQKGD